MENSSYRADRISQRTIRFLKLMFNLETAIKHWRNQMVTAGLHSTPALDELESHLREDIDRQARAGITPENAFAAAAGRVGEPGALKAEFAKGGCNRGLLEKVRICIAAVLIAAVSFLSVAAYILCYTTLADRLILAFAVFCILAIARYWPLAIPLLPVITERKSRRFAALAVVLFGFGSPSALRASE
jgi:hypothetical protein